MKSGNGLESMINLNLHGKTEISIKNNMVLKVIRNNKPQRLIKRPEILFEVFQWSEGLF